MSDTNEKLKKELSPLHVWALAFGCIIGWGAFVMPGNTFLVKAGPAGTAIAMGIAALIMIIIAFNYHFMINQYPVAGGEFTYATNAFGKVNGFICAWFLGLSYLAIVPLNATALALIGRNLLNNVFQTGFHYQVAGYDIYSGEIILAVAALILLAALSIRGVKTTGIFQMGLIIALVGGVCVIAAAALISPKATVSNLSPAYYPSDSKVSGILAIIAVAPWAFVGFDTIPQAAEEFHFSPKKAQGIMVLSILFGGAVYIILNTITAAVVPGMYNNWVEYITDLDNLTGLISLPTFYAAKELLGNAGLLFIGLAVLAAILSGIMGFYMATSRLLYSMAKGKFLPQWFGIIHEKYKTPINAILFVMIISIIAPFFGRTALGWIVDMSSVGAAIGYGYTSAAAFKYAKEAENKKIVITGALGTVISIIFILLLLVPIKQFNCSLSRESYICLFIWSLMGVAFYVWTRKKDK